MKRTTSSMGKQVCAAALSLALLPLAATAQTQAQSQSAYGTQNNAATQSQQGYVAGQNNSADLSQQGNTAGQNNMAGQNNRSGQSSTAGQANMAGQNNRSGQNNMAGQAGQQAMGASAQGAATASGAKQAGGAGTTPGASQAPTFVLVPVVSPLREQWMRSGCWARLYDNQGFSGDSLTLTGPIDMPDMVGPFGINWQDKISSIETGANTTLTVYDNALYRDPVSTFKPGARIPDVSKRMGFFDQMRSLRITCTVR
jgi:hypothetical protein